MRIHQLITAGAVTSVLSLTALAQPTQPATDRAAPEPSGGNAVNLPDGPLKATITAVQGNVQVRKTPNDPWVKAEVGMQLDEGAEFRTGVRSAVQFTIGPDQTITLDRLGTIALLRANIENGKFNTDVGMKYGRTRYDIEAAGREHNAVVRSPSSVLAIRGTEVSLYDQPPFAPRAVSLTGRAMFRDARKQVSVGSRGGTRVEVSADDNSPAEASLANATQLPRGEFAGRSRSDNQLGLTLSSFNQPELSVGIFETIGQAQNQATINSLSAIGTITGEQLSIELGILSGSPNVDVNLIVRTPFGDVININNIDNPSPSGGLYLVNLPSDATGANGFDQIVYDNPLKPAPKGVYSIQQILVNGGTATTTLTVLTDKLSDTPGTFGPIQTTLTTGSPTNTTQVNLGGSTVTPQSKKRKK
jgi:hypothetical protein